MIRYYTSRGLSEKFDVKLARWKRWCREFLPPDPLGGLQSGYARQYTVDEAFIVYLGGHLVSHLQFSIPDARAVLKELGEWLNENIGPITSDTNTTSPFSGRHQSPHSEMVIVIYHQNGKPVCDIHDIVDRQFDNGGNFAEAKEKHHVKRLSPDVDPQTTQHALSAKVLFLSRLLMEFARCLELKVSFSPTPRHPLQEGD